MSEDVSLFVRSYPNDFEWLKYSIRSMEKNLHGIDETVLVVPVSNDDLPTEFKQFFDRIFFTQETHEGYIAQQLDKVRAYKYCKFDNILFSDSDCMYFEPFGASSLLTNDNKVILYKTKYSSLSGDVLVWQNITERSTGIHPKFEYMRCLPIMHKAVTCFELDNNYIFKTYVSSLQDRSLSEFNALGVHAEETELRNQYEFLDTDERLPERKTKQYWSWGGITPEIREQLESI